MGMTAITANYGLWDAAELAVNAGVDILLYTSNMLNNASLVRQLVDSLEARVLRGRIAEARITEAYERIMALKGRYLVTGVRPTFAWDVPKGYLLANYPNPFNPATTIEFTIPADARVALSIHDISGRMVRRLCADEPMRAGSHRMIWDGKNSAGRPVASGTYFCRLRAGDRMSSVKLILMR
jgi:hypothetical protein